MSDTILRSNDSGVLTLTLNRPDALNSFNVEMKEALLAALKDAARDREVRVVVLTGAGRAFSAGQDLKERQAPGAADLGTELRTRYNPIILAMRRLEKPIIGAINGVAAGAGISVALACDIRIASEAASFIEVFGRVGLVPDTGSSWFLPRLIGPARAAEMFFTGEPVDAATAERIGLVNRVVVGRRAYGRSEFDGCQTRPRRATRRLASPSALSTARSKPGSRKRSNTRRSSSRSPAARADHAEGVAAFVEKRPARFTGE